MTARQVYEGTATEVNKVQSMTLLLEDFNYFFNKAIYQYINKRYNIYDINQQTTDDIRVLKATIALPVTLATSAYGDTDALRSLTEKQRLVLLKNVVLKIPMKQIALELGISISMVKKHKDKAIRVIKRRMSVDEK